jgi:hypothetical protein
MDGDWMASSGLAADSEGLSVAAADPHNVIILKSRVTPAQSFSFSTHTHTQHSSPLDHVLQRASRQFKYTLHLLQIHIYNPTQPCLRLQYGPNLPCFRRWLTA